MIRLTQTLGATTTVVAALALAGCAKPPVISPPKPEPIPTVIQLDITANAAVNADRHGRAMPIVVRFYLLQTTAAFDNADFFSPVRARRRCARRSKGRPGGNNPYTQSGL
ncbi:MAG: type VI secretion system lipoprotein TssJ [Zoogloea sp.]|nr:type VI secretion system lipoprotein TssJ [Zoogloea sp.]